MRTTHNRPTDITGNVAQARSPARALLGVLAATLAGIVAPAFAQEAAPTTSKTAEARSAGVLEEIIVTSTRREESLSKVALSVTALSQEALDLKGIKDFQDVARFMPGVTIDTGGTNAISIRGISSSAGAGTTGIYIDDTPIQMRSVGFNPDDTLPKTFDLERVEVLRGPQGTLFGSGSEGGTVRYLMTQPSLTKDSTYVRSEASFTRGGQASYEAGIAHGGPLIDNVLGYRASIWYRYDGGWIDRIDPTTLATVDAHANRANTIAGRLALLVQPAAGITITPSVNYQYSRKHDESTYWPVYSNVDAGQFKNSTPERLPVPDEYYLPALKIEADLGKTRLISNTSYFHRDEFTAYQGSVYDLAYMQSLSWINNNPPPFTNGTCGPAQTAPPCSWYPLLDANGVHLGALGPQFAHYSTPNVITNQQRAWTQEIRLQSNDEVNRWQWTVGGFWSLSREMSIEELKDTQFLDIWNTLFGVDPRNFYTDASGNGNWYFCNGVGTAPVAPRLAIPNCDIYYNRNITHDRQLAGFGEVSFALTDRVKLTAGGRFAKLDFDLTHFGDGMLNYGPDYLPSPRAAKHSENAFTPKLSMSFQIDPQNLFYATYAKGFRPGGGNAPLPSYCDGPGGLNQVGYPNGAPLTYKSDTTQSYEIGTKNALGNRLKVATSVYYIKWNSIQQNVYVPYNCGLQFTDNLGTALAKGFDLQAEMVLGAGFSLDASVGYTSARYTADSIAGGTNGPPPHKILATTGDAISGQAGIDYSPGTNPPWTVALGPQYNFDVAGHDAFVRLDYEYASRNNWPATLQDAASAQYIASTYTLSATHFASLRAGVTLGGLQLALFVDNLFDSRTTTSYAIGQSDANNPAFNRLLPWSVQENRFTFRPRTIGITATFRQ